MSNFSGPSGGMSDDARTVNYPGDGKPLSEMAGFYQPVLLARVARASHAQGVMSWVEDNHAHVARSHEPIVKLTESFRSQLTARESDNRSVSLQRSRCHRTDSLAITKRIMTALIILTWIGHLGLPLGLCVWLAMSRSDSRIYWLSLCCLSGSYVWTMFLAGAAWDWLGVFWPYFLVVLWFGATGLWVWRRWRRTPLWAPTRVRGWVGTAFLAPFAAYAEEAFFAPLSTERGSATFLG